jgi:S-adenosylmethionine:tRNA ribosyltransferase-isomerase
MIHRPDALKSIHIADYDYLLPDERIAKYPLAERDQSKLLVFKNGAISHTQFLHLPDIIGPDHLLVFNNTRVIPARLKFQKPTGAHIEIFCLEPVDPVEYQVAFQSHRCTWKCIVGNLKKWKDDGLTKTIESNGKQVTLTATKTADYRTHQHILFSWDEGSLTFSQIIELAGVTPIPPYLNRESEAIDRDRYQTVYSRIKGSVAAPTAGLHFTGPLLKRLSGKGISQAELTLHVGAGTFKPVQSDTIAEHEMHTEFFSITANTLQELVQNHGKIIAVGTTTLRTLESLYWLGVKMKHGIIGNGAVPHLDQWDAYELEAKMTYQEALQVLLKHLETQGLNELYATTQIMIAPGYTVRSIKALVTNFHQPKSTLLLLVSAITGEHWKDIYRYALENDFRFLSYGDSSVIFCK